MKKKKLGLALGSGGIRGFAHLGVIKALEEADIEISYITGASAGSIVGAFYAATKDTDWILKVFTENKTEIIKAFIDPSIKGALVKGRKMAALLNKWLPVTDFKDLKIPLTTVATDLLSGQPVYFSKGDLVTGIIASMSVPNVFEPTKFEGKMLLDGGLCIPVPDKQAREMGADVVVSVNLDNHNTVASPDAKYTSFKKIGYRSINIIRHYLAKYSLIHSDIILEPVIPMKSIMGLEKYFGKSNEIDKMIEEGYNIMQAQIPKLKELLK